MITWLTQSVSQLYRYFQMRLIELKTRFLLILERFQDQSGKLSDPFDNESVEDADTLEGLVWAKDSAEELRKQGLPEVPNNAALIVPAGFEPVSTKDAILIETLKVQKRLIVVQCSYKPAVTRF